MKKEVEFITHTNRWGRTNRFRVLDSWCTGHRVWNIGRANFPFECYIPLCHCDGLYRVDTSNLACVKLESEELALAVLKYSHYTKDPFYKWFENFRELFYMSFEERCERLIGWEIHYFVANKEKKDERGTMQFLSVMDIDEEKVTFKVRRDGDGLPFPMSFNKEFVRDLALEESATDYTKGERYTNFSLRKF